VAKSTGGAARAKSGGKRIAVPPKAKRGAAVKRVEAPESVIGAPAHDSPEHDALVRIVGIGASAGGLEAMKQLIPHLGAAPGLAIVYVQHLDPSHESFLAALLSTATKLPVVPIVDGIRVDPDRIFLAPPHTSVVVDGNVLRILPCGTAAGGAARTIDGFFASLATERGRAAAGVVLSGSASDGAAGLRAIRAAGGVTIAQDPATARFDGMPRSAQSTGCVDFVLSPERIARVLLKIARGSAAGLDDQDREDPVHRILEAVRCFAGVDFHGYKRAMIRRRIVRRMELAKLESLSAYADHLEERPEAVAELCPDLLINVSGFFREPEVFRTLRTKALPALLRDHPAGTPIRVWVPGCSTGEEAYSIAITLLEHLGSHVDRSRLQVFGTDVSESVIDRARAGVYSSRAVAGVSPERLRRFFVKQKSEYQIAPRVRELCIFAKQNLMRDPPFSRMNLISCRNVLIYLETPLQRRVMQILHYALQPRGVLVLGAAESVGPAADLFDITSRKQKIYVRRPSAVRHVLGFPPGERPPDRSPRPAEPPPALWDVRSDPEVLREVDRIVMSEFSPPGVLVDDRMTIVQFRGRAAPYLEHQHGDATLALFNMVQEELVIELRTAIGAARKTDAPVRRSGVAFSRDKGGGEVDIDVVPLRVPSSKARYFLILFSKSRAPAADAGGASLAAGGKPRASNTAERKRSERFERELAVTKEHLRAVVEEQDATNEELRAAMEEITSSNEELQSINEELETAKEELQSTNEELTTVNDELQTRNGELGQVNGDMLNLLSSVEIPIVLIGSDLSIRRFTPPAGPLLNLIPSDIGRPLANIRANITIDDLEGRFSRVIATGAPEDQEVQAVDGRSFTLWLRPYVDEDGRRTGVVMALLDVTERKRADRERRALEARMLEAQKLESLAVLAAGVAHDFNNLLTGILGNADLLGSEVPPGSVARACLDDLRSAGQRAAALTSQMLAYVGATHLELSHVELSTVVREMKRLIEAVVSKRTTLAFDLAEGLPQVKADKGRLVQVMLSLATNASEALIDREGTITVRTGIALPKPADLAALEPMHGLGEGAYPFIEVSDTGPGMSAEVRRRMFEPFFTTKFMGRGLGLAAVLGIVRQHGAAIGVVTAPDRGTSVRVLFRPVGPAVAPPTEPPVAVGEVGPTGAAGAEDRRRGKVMVVDDDDDVRVLVTRILSRLGYDALASKGGREAIRVLAERGAEVAAVILDVTREASTAASALASLRRVRPEVPVVVVTDVAEETAAERLLREGAAACIQKPFTVERLQSALKMVSTVS